MAKNPNTSGHTINGWEHDPGLLDRPDGGALISRPVPDLARSPLPTQIHGPQVPADNYSAGTPGFRYWTAADAVRRTADFWGQLLPATTKWNPSVGNVLPIVLDEGVDLNAYYDRGSLTFFHAVVSGRTVYSGESPDIVCHEFGHAVLDAIRPQLWDAASIEVGAFHESFGDMSALLAGLQIPSLRQGVLAETGGVLYRSSRLSRLAEQLGWAIRQEFPAAVDGDCLRNAVNQFVYSDPNDLPTSASGTELSSEVHSFSRVFTAAFFEALASAFAIQQTQSEEDLQSVSIDMAKILIDAIQHAPVTTAYYSQVAAHLVHAATRINETYAPVIQGAMVHHGVLSARGVATVATAIRTGVGAQPPGGALPTRELDVSAFGLTVPKIKVFAAGEPRRFGVAGASRAIGDLPLRSDEDVAMAFVEDLIRRGRLDPKEFADQKLAAIRPRVTRTHELRTEGSDAVLRRIRVDCGLHFGSTPGTPVR
jgi:hypothetical protein